jgi:hypothetical protein
MGGMRLFEALLWFLLSNFLFTVKVAPTLPLKQPALSNGSTKFNPGPAYFLPELAQSFLSKLAITWQKFIFSELFQL